MVEPAADSCTHSVGGQSLAPPGGHVQPLEPRGLLEPHQLHLGQLSEWGIDMNSRFWFIDFKGPLQKINFELVYSTCTYMS